VGVSCGGNFALESYHLIATCIPELVSNSPHDIDRTPWCPCLDTRPSLSPCRKCAKWTTITADKYIQLKYKDAYHATTRLAATNSQILFLYGTTSKEKESSSRPYITLALHSSGCLLNLQELQQELYSSVVFPVFGRAPCRERIVTASSTISRSGIPILSSGGGECQ